MSPSPEQKSISESSSTNEIDLLELTKVVWLGRKTILKYIGIAGLLGLLIGLLSPAEYNSSTTMVPQTGKSIGNLGGLSSLAAIAGFDIDATKSSDALSPLVYPQILNSGPFQLELMNTLFTFAEIDDPVSLYEYYTNIARPGITAWLGKYTIGLPGLIFERIKGDQIGKTNSEKNGPIFFTNKQEKIRKILNEKISLNIDSKQGFLTLNANFHEAVLSAQVAEKTRELLQKYITRFKVEKATDQLYFVEDRYQEKKKDFERAQERLAHYRDQNKNITGAMAHTEEERLISEYNISMNVFNELAKQLEQAKIKVKEETPVFSVLEPAIVPNEKSKPQKGVIILIWLFIGGIAGTFKVIGKGFMKGLSKRWNEIK